MLLDPYDVLGLSKGASVDDAKRAYRRLSKEWHPDKHKGEKRAEEHFKEINEAYEILGDPEKKQKYDDYGARGGGAAGQSPFEGFDVSGFSGGLGDLGSIFEGMFGGRGRTREERGEDYEIAVEVALRDVLFGIERQMHLRMPRACEECKGSGAATGKVQKCGKCGGTGEVLKTARSFFGVVQQRMHCPDCRGTGKVPESSCHQCQGEGRRVVGRDLTVKIPPGIRDGQRMRISGEGGMGRQGMAAGDLYVTVRVPTDERFRRDGNDIHTDIALPLLTAMLGGEISVPTLHGDITLRIPEGTQPEQVFRLKRKGLPDLGSSRMGDHYVRVQVEIPKKLSREERRLLEEWKALQ
ncbi:molecular chaperone DnaJ [Candidatus Peribacteria bacterium RIFCSPLOWO2_12_FULL_55_15]|nr:MAG: molecular chaperone DnaJ [Candidatus Peribacteria bacterium RIFCSPHIGHO2_01_FULL_54_22]OGJ63674.1 MAG: molecular chaperone DnaJ [Candidatus Peribacteria bacterium RIFCSPHIGHO2_02_FULL_55_24]OGJ63744.1 MAG: molecular chaperone DnaJ [Candidatus Peribacteria bacterium RIFCSPHIGHO2_12_FULL_54_10]OGJ68656.1 MAG: molecular chaperone DnaJ [Candidatus Peribacteria bacterium RIFCSPLOWO2_02_FULL_55_36]OGJ68665.1 MAG: molecular chaperone DnaJ [Candidatus Peribacteria bacterium RIFCSPLOWO2_01_FULL_